MRSILFSRWALFFLLLLGCCFFVAAQFSEPGGADWETYKGLPKGMKMGEVLSILGPPTYHEPTGTFGNTVYLWDRGEQRIVAEFRFADNSPTAPVVLVEKRFYPKTRFARAWD